MVLLHQSMTDLNRNKELINALSRNEDLMTDLLIAVKTICKQYPPAKNENKFIYGKLIEKKIIEVINKILPCIELDADKKVGSEYKNDCSICFSDGYILDYSIKASKNGGSPTLVNKRNKSEHDVNKCYFIICHITKERLYIFNHSDDLNAFLKDSHESIQYKSAVFRYLDKSPDNYFQFPRNEKMRKFNNEILPDIKSVDIYSKLLEDLEKYITHYT